jgi:CBS domain-containing protein
MTRDVRVASPDHTIEAAARVMTEIDAGALPVAENDQLVGMITDRDIAVRAVGQGKGPQTRVREVMTPVVKYCFEDEPITQVAHNMGDVQLRRLPVVNRDKRLVGSCRSVISHRSRAASRRVRPSPAYRSPAAIAHKTAFCGPCGARAA